MAGNCWHAMTHAGELGNTLPLARATPTTVTPTVGKSGVGSRRPRAYAAPRAAERDAAAANLAADEAELTIRGSKGSAMRSDGGEFEILLPPGGSIELAYHVVPALRRCRSIAQGALFNGTVRT